MTHETQPELRCPCCNGLLDFEPISGGVIIWCGHGPCASYEANDGMVGRTLNEAYLSLVRVVEAEMESQ